MSVTTTATTYLHVLPLSAQHTDMFDLFREDDTHALPQLVQQFLSGKAWESDIHGSDAQTHPLQHYYITAKNVQKTLGSPILGLGFPILVQTQTDGTPLSAPLFIRYVALKPHPLRPNSWLLSSDGQQRLHPNRYLLDLLYERYGQDFSADFEAFAAQKNATDDDLLILCQRLMSDLGQEATPITKALQPVPHPTLLAELSDLGSLLRTGVLGLFPPQEGDLALPTDIDCQTPPEWATEQRHEYALLPEDVSQRAALRTLFRHKATVVEGAHGSGKTHLALNLLVNNASNGLKSALIAKDMATLHQVQAQLVDLGLGHLCFLLKDLSTDAPVLLDSIRHEASAKAPEPEPADFSIVLKQARRLLAQSDDTHQALTRPIFGTHTFADTVGLYLKSQSRAGRDLLAHHLSSKDYAFNEAEYTALQTLIAESDVLFAPIQTLRHPLSILHPEPFLAAKKADAQQFFEQNLQEFAQSIKDLHHEYIAVYDAYAQKLLYYYEAHHEGLRHQLRYLKDAFSDFAFQYGSNYSDSGFLNMGSLYATALFSDKSKQILSAKEDTIRQYGLLAERHQEKRFFNHTFLNASERKDLGKIKTNLEAFELSLRAWRQALATIVQEELQRLNSKTAAFFDAPSAEILADLEHKLDQLLEDLNAVTLYAESQGHKMLTIPKRMLFLEHLTEKIADTRLQMRDFDAFYDWQRHFLTMPSKGQKLIQALVKVKPQNWQSAFESWYLHHVLVNHYQSDTLQNDVLMADMVAAHSRLRQMLPAQISAHWYERKKKALSSLKSTNNRAYKALTSNKAAPSDGHPKALIALLQPVLYDIYPIILTTPHLATQIVAPEGKEFDWIVLDNAQHLEVAPVAALLKNTSGMVALAAETTGAVASTLRAQGAAHVQLNVLHQPQSMPIRQLNTRVFYGDLAQPLGQQSANQTLSVQHIMATPTDRKGTNFAEIRAIISHIEALAPNKYQTYPRIGIVCMTIEQRDALAIQVLNIVQRKDRHWEKWAHLQRHHLDILHHTEIFGQTFDYLIVSGVHTQLNHVDVPLSHFKALVNSFKEALVWFNSISRDQLTDGHQAADFQALLAQLLLMTEQYEQSGGQSDTEAWAALSARFDKRRERWVSPFWSHIDKRLTEHGLSERLIQPFVWQNHIFDAAIRPETPGGKTMILRLDGRFDTESNYFHADWEQEMLNRLQADGLGVVTIWSPQWWRQEAQALEQLLAAIAPDAPQE